MENHGLKVAKIYPPLGYRPTHEVLMKDVYPYLEKNNLPVMTHCSRGGVRHKSLSKKTTTGYTHPDQYKEVLETFPNLKFCLGHFGGKGDWEMYLDDPWTKDSKDTGKSWLAEILDMMRSVDETGAKKYPNLFADISYTIFRFEEYVDLLKVLLADDRIRTQVLFGSDYYMTEKEKPRERRLAISLRARLGEALFWQIAETNPQRYLPPGV